MQGRTSPVKLQPRGHRRDSELDALLRARAKGEVRGKLEERIAGMRSLLETKLPGA